MSNSINETSIKKLKLLITVVDRQKGDFYAGVISQFDVNFQMILSGRGTATSELIELLDLNPHKAVILSVLREDKVESVINALEDRFATVKNGAGIAFLPDYITESAMQSGSIVRLHVPGYEVELWKQLFYHRDKWLSPPMQAALSHFADTLLRTPAHSER